MRVWLAALVRLAEPACLAARGSRSLARVLACSFGLAALGASLFGCASAMRSLELSSVTEGDWTAELPLGWRITSEFDALRAQAPSGHATLYLRRRTDPSADLTKAAKAGLDSLALTNAAPVSPADLGQRVTCVRGDDGIVVSLLCVREDAAGPELLFQTSVEAFRSYSLALFEAILASAKFAKK